ncbi:hypothetical protein CAOG_00637 [Capsaspora owczarzaki ATCC 30864]|uniref:UBA domain-containing protein n=1 Tax=Capsaspora owczarzaki (strain ATCC 30864) TaxID=595528 RepID=A0A0D2WIW6_CAPO3|nr:hypothetical protein CAOG_00637 [Capsaspora owczarzaki ATCC 30864]KJE89088.1 hypothetical protein CAOG_000637 [Capsaspora owczarzaki ATCC 30864]|eukprot:XP_004365508.1 hypothetical protein CAOG_00637 [Capsaspora owczarzaki ATCC 30864]
MCGRAACALAPHRLQQATGVASSDNWAQSDKYRPSYNVGPGRFQPVMLASKHNPGTRELRCMTWGLIPSYTKQRGDFSTLLKTINARADRLQESGVYRRLVNKKRCVLPVTGFFEWLKKGKDRIPYFMFRKSCATVANPEEFQPLFFAGLYDVWYPDTPRNPQENAPPPTQTEIEETDLHLGQVDDDDDDGDHEANAADAEHEPEAETQHEPESDQKPDIQKPTPEFSYTIITVDSDPDLRWLHDRMPVILQSQEEIDQWLNPDLDFRAVQHLLRPAHNFLQWYQVPHDVNKVGNDLPTNVRPIKEASKITSFFKVLPSPKKQQACASESESFAASPSKLQAKLPADAAESSGAASSTEEAPASPEIVYSRPPRPENAAFKRSLSTSADSDSEHETANTQLIPPPKRVHLDASPDRSPKRASPGKSRSPRSARRSLVGEDPYADNDNDDDYSDQHSASAEEVCVVDEAAMSELQAMGFPEEVARHTLLAFNNDLPRAINSLLSD